MILKLAYKSWHLIIPLILLYLPLYIYYQKRFYNREAIPFIRISSLAASISRLTWSAEIFESRKGLIIWVAGNTFTVFQFNGAIVSLL